MALTCDEIAALTASDRSRPDKTAEVARLREALQPFANCVFNDNGDVTYDFSHVKASDYFRAYKTLQRS